TGGLSGDPGAPILYYAPAKSGLALSTVLIRARPDADPSAALRAIVPALEPRIIPPVVRTAESLLVESIATQRFTMVLLAVFAGVAVVLSAIGLYGVISYMVTQRTREIGIRIALGAHPSDVARSVVKRGLVLCAVGLGAGL